VILLDTNAVIALLKGKPSSVRAHFESAINTGEKVLVSVIALYELRYGAARSAWPEDNGKRIDEFLSGAVDVCAFDSEDAAEAGVLRAALEVKGRPIGPYDLLIAAQARRRSASIVTANKREFERVEGLTVLDWSS
jgi:tRNA(fMet)-specific endonuclease VapC